MILNLSGGVPLNFSVTAYSSASALPSSAPENAIGVITTTAITSYVFSSTQPTARKRAWCGLMCPQQRTLPFPQPKEIL